MNSYNGKNHLIKLVYDQKPFYIHTGALCRIPYLFNMAGWLPLTSGKAIVNIGVVDAQPISTALGFSFTAYHMSVILQWAYDRDTKEMLNPPIWRSKSDLLDYEQWLKVAQFMTIPGLDEDLTLAIQIAKTRLKMPKTYAEAMSSCLSSPKINDALEIVVKMVLLLGLIAAFIMMDAELKIARDNATDLVKVITAAIHDYNAETLAESLKKYLENPNRLH